MSLKVPKNPKPHNGAMGSGLEAEALNHICGRCQEECCHYLRLAIYNSMDFSILDVRGTESVEVLSYLVANVAFLSPTGKEEFTCFRIFHDVKVSTFASHKLTGCHPIVNNHFCHVTLTFNCSLKIRGGIPQTSTT